MLDSWLSEILDHSIRWLCDMLAQWIIDRFFRSASEE